jgi:hypothetical protein
MRICFWSTTFQSDNHALAHHLALSPDFEVTVAMPSPERFAQEAALSILPFRGRLLERDAADTKRTLKSEPFDCVVLDNHVPSYAIAPRIYVLWHGFGWRIDDLKTMRKAVGKLVGDVTRANERFRWHAIGEWDRQYRIDHSEIHPANVQALGSPYSDWLLPDSPVQARFDRLSLQPRYTIDLARKVVMLGLTWHHGGSLGHWGDEETLLARLVEHVAARGASTLLRMHDKSRYQRGYIELVERLAQRFSGSLMLKWKDRSPDSLVDLLVSDVCISNYSSLLNAFYYTGRPSIHIDPHDASASAQHTYKLFMGLPMRTAVSTPEALWKLPPDQHGGLRAQSFDELLTQVDRALADPSCCSEQARAFVARYVSSADGASSARAADGLRGWLRS